MLGRGLDYAILLEGALKLKEVSYIHTEAYASGELKHGTIALITEKTPVVALVTQERVRDKELSNIREVQSRGASVVILVKDGIDLADADYTHVFTLPAMDDVARHSLPRQHCSCWHIMYPWTEVWMLISQETWQKLLQ